MARTKLSATKSSGSKVKKSSSSSTSALSKKSTVKKLSSKENQSKSTKEVIVTSESLSSTAAVDQPINNNTLTLFDVSELDPSIIKSIGEIFCARLPEMAIYALVHNPKVFLVYIVMQY